MEDMVVKNTLWLGGQPLFEWEEALGRAIELYRNFFRAML